MSPKAYSKNLTTTPKISLKEAKQIILSAQGLNETNAFGSGLRGVQNAIEHLGYIQIDTISVVERAHNHIVWSRVNDAGTDSLDQLIEQKNIFEYWSHAASFLPMRDFRFSLPRKKIYSTGKRGWLKPTAENLKIKKMVLQRIKSEGALSARDFTNEQDSKRAGWWDWKPAKLALEQLFLEGKLMVSSRRGFQKVYDLTERVLPADVDTRHPSDAEYARYLALSSLKAHGLVRTNEMSHLRPSLRPAIEIECEKLLRTRQIEKVFVEGLERPYLAISDEWRNCLEKPVSPRIQILSPFDNQVIQRKRLKEIFTFDYTIECYVPEPKRKYGYFSLPILKGDVFCGRTDVKADRATKTLLVRSFHVEKNCGSKKKLWEEMQEPITDFAKFNGCTKIQKSFR